MTMLQKIEKLMLEKGIKNKRELSELSGIAYTTIDGLFKKGGNPKLSTLLALKNFFGCSLDFLVDDECDDRKVFETEGAPFSDGKHTHDLGEILKTAAVVTVDGSELTEQEIEEVKKYIRYGVIARRRVLDKE